MSAFIQFKDVKKTYKVGDIEIHASNGVNFEVNKGEFVVIVGPSGAGKTTILNLLGGMDQPTSGSIMVDGQDVARYDEAKLTQYRRDDIGFVFQFYNLVQNLTALENVELASQISKDPLDEKMVLKRVELENRMNNFPAQLSGGEQQRVAIARAIAKNPKLLLCDEPTGALDSKSSHDLLECLKLVNDNDQATILMVTHDAFSASYAKEVYILSDGAIKCKLTKGQNQKEFYDRIIEMQASMGSDFS